MKIGARAPRRDRPGESVAKVQPRQEPGALRTDCGKTSSRDSAKADTIRRNLEMVETEVRKNESSRKNNEASINNKLEELTTKQEEHRELLEGLEAKLAKDEEKIQANQGAWEAEVAALKEKSASLLEDLNRRTESTQTLVENIRSSVNKEISTQCLMVKELCRAGNEDLRCV